MFVLVLTLALAGSRFITETSAAGAFAIGKCGAYGRAYDYAGEKVAPRISSSLNEATRKCYESGGKECVIRAWACDAKG